jgi:chloramphenicol-sensitive protein RarD
VAYALLAYTFWGFVPVYFVLVGFADPFEVLAQRIVWSLPLLAVLITLAGQWRAVADLRAREFAFLVGSALCLSVNWLAFIWAIHDGNIVETSLGYFINPLVSVLLGWAVLKERMSGLQWCAAAIAAGGIVIELLVEKLIPFFGLTIALSFGVYGLLRKQVNLPSSVGLGVETSLVFPFALLFLLGTQGVERSGSELSLLALGGLVTVFPLICFAAAATRMPLTMLGIIQYLAPTLSLLLAVYVYEEAVGPVRWFTLTAVLIAVVLFSVDAVVEKRRSLGSET